MGREKCPSPHFYCFCRFFFVQAAAPWHFLYFLPEPQKQGSLRPICLPERCWVTAAPLLPPAMRAASSSRCFLRSNSRSRVSMVVEGARPCCMGALSRVPESGPGAPRFVAEPGWLGCQWVSAGRGMEGGGGACGARLCAC